MAAIILANITPVDDDEIAPIATSTVSDRSKADDIPNHYLEQYVPSHAREREDIPPNGGFGWVCVACLHLINGHTWGLNSAYGVILAYYLSHNTFPDATPMEYAFVGGLSISQSLLISPLVTLSTRCWGTRVTLLIGIFLETMALIGASFATTVWQLFLSQGVCFGWGIGFLFVGSMSIIPQWFSTKRSLAMGISAAGAGLWGLIYNLVAAAAIQHVGLAWTYRLLAIIGFVVNLSCSLLVRDRNKDVRPYQLAFDYRLFVRTEFLLMLGWGVLSELGYIILLYSLPNYAISIGLTAQQGSVVGAVLNLGLGVGRPVVGYFSDSLGRINMATIMTGFCGLICLVIWIFAKSYGVLLFFALLAGTVCGTFWSTAAPVGAEVVGLKELPSTLSMLWLMLVIPTTVAEPIALKLRRATGDVYVDAQVFVGFMFIGAALCTWLLRSWKVDQVDRDNAKRENREDHRLAASEVQSAASLRRTFKSLFVWRRV